MSQDTSGSQQPYSFGRDRHFDGHEQHGSPPEGHRDIGSYGGGTHSAGHTPHAQGHLVGGEQIPPPPAGYRAMGTVVVLYLVAGFMLLWTGACAAVTLDGVVSGDSDDALIGLFMTVGSAAIVIGLAAWLVRIHRRRASYQRILDHHYAQRFGHHPGRF